MAANLSAITALFEKGASDAAAFQQLTQEEQAEKEGAVDGHPEADASQPPPLLRAALAMVREDLKAIRRSQTEARANA